jgi:hypothetical protein
MPKNSESMKVNRVLLLLLLIISLYCRSDTDQADPKQQFSASRVKELDSYR